MYLSDFREGDPAVSKSIDNSITFLSLVSLIALIVGSLAWRWHMYSHLQQRMDTIAVMKGNRRPGEPNHLDLSHADFVAGCGGRPGRCGDRSGRTISFPVLIQRVFSMLPNVAWDWSFSLQGMSVGVLATLLFTLPPLLSIRNVRPSLVFRRDMPDAAISARKHWRNRLPAALLVVAMLAGWYGIAVWLSGSSKMGFYFVAARAPACCFWVWWLPRCWQSYGAWCEQAGGSFLRYFATDLQISIGQVIKHAAY